MRKNRGWSVKKLIMISMLVALYVVLERFLSINAWNMRLGFAFTALAIAALLYGPVAAALCGALGDIVGMMIFPTGPYFPGFTLTAALTGAVFGIFLYKKQTMPRILAAVGINQICLSLLLQTLWISITYGSPYRALLPVRLTQCLVMIPVQLVVVTLLGKPLLAAAKKTQLLAP